jgi:hypothetical protein
LAWNGINCGIEVVPNMPLEIPETIKPSIRGIQYSVRDLFLYFLAITLLISGYTTACSGTVSENVSSYVRYVLPVIVGCLLYLIGTSIRRRMNYSRFPPVTRITLILVLLISAISICYLSWAYERVYSGKFIFSGPREWPYPDRALLKLASWHEIYYPTSIKITEIHNEDVIIPHGEPPQIMFARYIFVLDILIGSFFAIVAWCSGLLLPFRLEWLDKLKLVCKRCLMRR